MVSRRFRIRGDGDICGGARLPLRRSEPDLDRAVIRRRLLVNHPLYLAGLRWCCDRYVVAHSAPAAWLIRRLAVIPKTGRGAVAYIAMVSMVVSLFSWTISLIFGGLLVCAIARRQELKMDYRAGAAAGYMGIGATWALGLSSAAAQIQANPASLPKALIPITGVISFHETIFLWQNILYGSGPNHCYDLDCLCDRAWSGARQDR